MSDPAMIIREGGKTAETAIEVEFWWIPRVGMKAKFTLSVPTIAAGRMLEETFAGYDVGGVQFRHPALTEGEWWSDDDDDGLDDLSRTATELGIDPGPLAYRGST